MAKARSRSRVKAAVPVNAQATGGKCECNLVWMVVAWILGAIGLWALVGGFALQFGSVYPTGFDTSVLGWYFVGLVLVGLAKITKWKACGNCSMHSHAMMK